MNKADAATIAAMIQEGITQALAQAAPAAPVADSPKESELEQAEAKVRELRKAARKVGDLAGVTIKGGTISMVADLSSPGKLAPKAVNPDGSHPYIVADVRFGKDGDKLTFKGDDGKHYHGYMRVYRAD